MLAEGCADMVSMARPFLADPEFVAKARAGRSHAITPCIACNQACLDHTFELKVSTCLVNPRACHETELVYAPAEAPKRVAVVGAGPAGLAAALVAAGRGHAVTLFEKDDRIGGQLTMAMRIPGKEEFVGLVDYYARAVAEAGIDLRLGAPAGPDDLAGFDAVVIATGVTPRDPGIRGADAPHVLSYVDVLRGGAEVGPRVAIVGAGGHRVRRGGVPREVRAFADAGAAVVAAGVGGRGSGRDARRARARGAAARSAGARDHGPAAQGVEARPGPGQDHRLDPPRQSRRAGGAVPRRASPTRRSRRRGCGSRRGPTGRTPS